MTCIPDIVYNRLGATVTLIQRVEFGRAQRATINYVNWKGETWQTRVFLQPTDCGQVHGAMVDAAIEAVKQSADAS